MPKPCGDPCFGFAQHASGLLLRGVHAELCRSAHANDEIFKTDVVPTKTGIYGCLFSKA